MDIKDLKVGTKFRGNVNGVEMEIIKIQNTNAVIKDEKGHTFTYGLGALSRCDITILN